MAKTQSRAIRSTARTSSRAPRRAKVSVSYRESSSEFSSNASDTELDSDSDEPIAIKAANKRSSRPRAENTLASSKRWRGASHSSSDPAFLSSILYEEGNGRQTKKISDGHLPLAKPVSTPLHELQENHKPVKIPNWASLPYHILVQIFHYATYPLFDEETFQPSPLAGWLTKMARVCRSFSEPAVTALYRSPPLIPMKRAHLLRQLLGVDMKLMIHNYPAKVEQLQVEVSQTTAHTLPGFGQLDLCGIVYNCPRLLDLEFYHVKDIVGNGQLDETIKWSYPDSLFSALDQNVTGSPTRLRSWRWNSRLAGKKRPIQNLVQIHESLPFRGLRKVAFVNYGAPPTFKKAEGLKHEKMLADSLSALKELEHLILESSSLVTQTLLPLLPNNLRHLELIHCWRLISDDLIAFLPSHGGQLRSLILKDNNVLSLSYLSVLRKASPYLETFKMNQSHFNRRRASFNGQRTIFDRILIGEKEAPEWPSSLKTIEITQLPSLDITEAEIFFQSLLSNAGNLMNLRRLVIKAKLNASSWRERCSIRDAWDMAFQRKFKRQFVPPDPLLRSVDECKAFSRSEEEACGDRIEKGKCDDGSEEIYTSCSTSIPQVSSHSRRIIRRGTRRTPVKVSTGSQHGQIGIGNDLERDFRDSQSFSQDSREKQAKSKELESPKHITGIQGMCDVVSITFDNLRPAKKQYVEADFLDSEPEGDEDWDGTDEVDGDEGGYAW